MPAETMVLGAGGMVGSAICRALELRGEPYDAPFLDLRDREACRRTFDRQRPKRVYLAAARVGGIVANNERPVDFLLDNLEIAANVLRCAHEFDVHRVLNLGSSCIYPREAEQPMQEASLLSGPLEPTNRAYAIAKIAAIEMCDAYRRQYDRDYISAMPCNLYGENDNFHLRDAHVLPAMIRKFIEAEDRGEPVKLWGDGLPRRELMHVDDLACACLMLMDTFSDSGPINVGTGTDVAIHELADMVAKAVGFRGTVQWDCSMPTGTPRKVLDVSRIAGMGWKPEIALEDGIPRVVSSVRSRLRNRISIRGWT